MFLIVLFNGTVWTESNEIAEVSMEVAVACCKVLPHNCPERLRGTTNDLIRVRRLKLEPWYRFPLEA
jgi:hypothetical protein